MKRIATSENIKTFITRDFIYIDKTEFIYKLVSNHERVFFSRPRRFGKSLTLNIIGTLFEKGPDPYFKKTWIYDKWDLGTCPVLKINFLNCPADNPAEFKRSLCIIIKNALRRMKITDYQDDSEPNILINNAFSALEELDRQIVIIIDEYDRPLTANLENRRLYKEYHAILHLCRGVFLNLQPYRCDLLSTQRDSAKHSAEVFC